MKNKTTYKIPKGCDRRTLYLSGRHMDAADDRNLADAGLLCDPIDGGWLVVVDDDHDEQNLETISDVLKETYNIARRLGFSYLRFDCDAPVIKNFPIGKWS